MKLKVPATKTNLLKFSKILTLTQEGYNLLDEKRKILMAELTTVVHVADRLQKDLDEALAKGYDLVDQAIVSHGIKPLQNLSRAINIESNLAITSRRIMGVSVPIIDLKMIEHPPYYSLTKSSLYYDEIVHQFKEILTIIAKLAAKKIALLRIAKEAQKTIRKVNALEKIYIPYYEQGVKIIRDRLDEETREAFALSKIIKERLQRTV